jgi:ABC-2 type transport system permease protein
VSSLTGSVALIRLALRRDRVRLVVWVVALAGLLGFSSAAVQDLYRTDADLAGYARLVLDNPAIVIQTGPGHGLDDPTVGAVLANETMGWSAVVVALLGVLTVSRHTRAEEESGRAELVRAAVVGRHAPTAAALVVGAGAGAAVGAASTAALAATGMGLAGSAAFGAALAATGLALAAATLLAAQLTTSARVTTGAGVAAVAVAFVLRAVGDVTGGPWSWLSPVGWAQSVRPWAGERWWVLGLPVAVSAALVAGAWAVAARRDLGAGLLRERPGPARAAPWTTRPLGLTFRLQRGPLAAWSAGLATLGVSYGAVGDQVEEILAVDPDLAEFLAAVGGAPLIDAFFATAMVMLALVGSGFALSSALRARGEELAGRAEVVLATATSRWRWAGAHLAVAAGGSAVVVVVAGLGVGVGYAAVTGDATQVGRLLGAAAVQVPAVWVMVGLATAVWGLAPRATPAVWAGLALVVVVGLLGELLGLPQVVRNLSPFQHTPPLPAAPMAWGPVLALVGVAAGLATAGLAGFARRDVG